MRKHKLVRLRKANQLTQGDVAIYLGLHETSYGRIENGTSLLRERTILKLCSLYCCEPMDLIEAPILKHLKHANGCLQPFVPVNRNEYAQALIFVLRSKRNSPS